MIDGHDETERSTELPTEMSAGRSRTMKILFRLFTILEFGFLGFILYDLFRKYILTGNLDWWKR
ncbi:MAG: hypothetical protein ACYCYP_10165 [Leptospirales bacterium]